MARFVDVIDLPLGVDESFDYIADFANTAEWDPGVLRARKLADGPVATGSQFELQVGFLGRSLPFIYEVVALERPHRLVLEGSDGTVRSLDEITFAPREDGTRVTYEATLRLSGWRRLADPLLNLVFQVVGCRAVDGLRRRFTHDATESLA